MKDSGQACAKCILGGEHSIVHRGRALSFPIPHLRLTVHKPQPEIDPFEGLLLNGARGSSDDWSRVQKLFHFLDPELPVPKGIRIDSTVPIAKGLGSSAALATAMGRMLTDLKGKELAKLARQGEQLLCGASSGLDPTTVALEEPIVFRSGDQSYRILNSTPFSQSGLSFLLRDSGAQHDTGRILEEVGRIKHNTPLVWEDLMDALATNAEQMIPAFEQAQATDLGRLMNDTQFRLKELGVSNDVLNALCEDLRQEGALGAKITGAGCGGYVLALFHKSQLPRLREGDYVVTFRA